MINFKCVYIYIFTLYITIFSAKKVHIVNSNFTQKKTMRIALKISKCQRIFMTKNSIRQRKLNKMRKWNQIANFKIRIKKYDMHGGQQKFHSISAVKYKLRVKSIKN